MKAVQRLQKHRVLHQRQIILVRSRTTTYNNTINEERARDASRQRPTFQDRKRGDRQNRTPEREETYEKRRREQSRNRRERTRSPEYERHRQNTYDRSMGRDRRWSPTRY